MPVTGHRISWFVYTGGSVADDRGVTRPERVPHTSNMRGRWPRGYDVECSCGWRTRTGGGVRSYIRREVAGHRLDVELGLVP